MADERDFEEVLNEVKDIAETISDELTEQGRPSIKGLLLEIERQGGQIEDKILPKILNRLGDVESAVLAGALVIAQPQNPQKALEDAYKTANEFLTKQNKSF